MMKDKRNYLEIVDVLQDLTPEEMDAVGQQTHMVAYAAGHLFYMPDDPGEVLFILKRGRVQLYRMSVDGRKLIVATLQPGSIFGQMAIIGQRLHSTYAQALDDCVICIWNRQEVEQLLISKPEVGLRFLQLVGERLTEAEDRLVEMAFKRIPSRMAALLLRISEVDGDLTLRGYTHQYLADMLGTYRETATQTLNDFQRRSLIALSRKQIVIRDSEGLAAIATE